LKGFLFVSQIERGLGHEVKAVITTAPKRVLAMSIG